MEERNPPRCNVTQDMNLRLIQPVTSDDFCVFLLLRNVRRDPLISVKTSAPSLTAQISRGNATSGSRTTEVRVKGSAVACLPPAQTDTSASATAPNPCELNCIPRGENFFYRHRSAVVDGTPCHPGRRDVCVDGACKVSPQPKLHLHLLQKQ